MLLLAFSATFLYFVAADNNQETNEAIMRQGPMIPIPTDSRCKAVRCPAGQTCQAINVQCIHAPCPPPQIRCVPTPSINRCLTVRCAAGQICQNGICVSSGSMDPQNPCARHQCPIGQICQNRPAGSCARLPCFPTPFCTPSGNPTNPCATMLCPVGHVCQQTTINCIRAPCPPSPASCVPIGSGTHQCPRNEFWNSCGGCDNTCQNQHVVCPAICNTQGACRCNQGFYRHQNGRCVTLANCRTGIF